MIFRVFHVFILKFESKLLLVVTLFLQLVLVKLHDVEVLLKNLFIVSVHFYLLFEPLLHLNLLLFKLLHNVCDKQLIVTFAAVLEHDSKDLPD